MALKDRNVITASTGFVYTGTPGLAFPTPDEIEAFDPLTFGSVQYTVEVTASSGTVDLKVGPTGTVSTASVPFDSTAAAIQTALEALPNVGAGNAEVAEDSGSFVITFTGALQGTDPILTAGTGADVSVKTALNGWTMVGHSSRTDMPEFGVDGGDTEIKGTWQNVALKQVQTETPADFVTYKLVQIDRASMSQYYGPEIGPKVPGVFRYSGNPGANEQAFLVVITDGDVNLGFAAKKASFKRDDSIDMPVDDFMALPIRATFLKHGANDLFQWISKDLFD